MYVCMYIYIGSVPHLQGPRLEPAREALPVRRERECFGRGCVERCECLSRVARVGVPCSAGWDRRFKNINVQRLRGGLVFKAHGLLYHGAASRVAKAWAASPVFAFHVLTGGWELSV